MLWKHGRFQAETYSLPTNSRFRCQFPDRNQVLYRSIHGNCQPKKFAEFGKFSTQLLNNELPSPLFWIKLVRRARISCSVSSVSPSSSSATGSEIIRSAYVPGLRRNCQGWAWLAGENLVRQVVYYVLLCVTYISVWRVVSCFFQILILNGPIFTFMRWMRSGCPHPIIVSTSCAVVWLRKNFRNVRSSVNEQDRIGCGSWSSSLRILSYGLGTRKPPTVGVVELKLRHLTWNIMITI